jgi:hypothetical protein
VQTDVFSTPSVPSADSACEPVQNMKKKTQENKTGTPSIDSATNPHRLQNMIGFMFKGKSGLA